MQTSCPAARIPTAALSATVAVPASPPVYRPRIASAATPGIIAWSGTKSATLNGSIIQPPAGSCSRFTASTGNTIAATSGIHVQVFTAFSTPASFSPSSARPYSSTCVRMWSGSA